MTYDITSKLLRAALNRAVPLIQSGSKGYHNFTDLLDDLKAYIDVSDDVLVVKVAANGGTDTGGGLFAWAAPADCFVSRVILDVTTVASAACTVSIGTTATSAVTLSNNLITALATNTATGAFDNYVNPGVSGKAMQRLSAGKWVTGSTASGASAAMVANAYIFYTTV